MATSTRSLGVSARLARMGLAGGLLMAMAVADTAAAATAPVETVLARPLFALGRRPAVASAAAVVPGPVALPRVAGTIVGAGQRRAIFAAVGDGRPLVVAEGGEVAGFRITAIAPGRVTVMNAAGTRTLRTSADLQRAPAPSAAPARLPDYGLPAILPPAEPVIAPLNSLPLLPGTPDRAFPSYSAALGRMTSSSRAGETAPSR